MKKTTLMTPGSEHTFTIEKDSEGVRLDLFLMSIFSDCSRNFFQTIIKQNNVKVNNKIITKAGYRLKNLDIVFCTFPKVNQRSCLSTIEAEKLGIKIVFEHKDFLIINKPAGLLVHKPHKNSTEYDVVDWLLHHYQTISHVGFSERPGIVHRLDKDTSGLLIIALTPQGHSYFAQLFKQRTLKKEYLLLVEGHPQEQGIIDFPLGRHPVVRTKITHVHNGRAACTEFKVITYFKDTTLIKANLITGRTHQIRVHFSTLGHPLIGDTLYGKSSRFIKRQALHAHHLSFEYADQQYTFTQDIPADFKYLLDLQKKLQ